MPDSLQNPVIVMGMARSGTTLVAEMLHLGGTSMYDDTAHADPSYDKGIRYERRITYQLDNEILGLAERQDAITLVDRPLHPLPNDALARIAPEVGDRPWGFKNPAHDAHLSGLVRAVLRRSARLHLPQPRRGDEPLLQFP